MNAVVTFLQVLAVILFVAVIVALVIVAVSSLVEATDEHRPGWRRAQYRRRAVTALIALVLTIAGGVTVVSVNDTSDNSGPCISTTVVKGTTYCTEHAERIN